MPLFLIRRVRNQLTGSAKTNWNFHNIKTWPSDREISGKFQIIPEIDVFLRCEPSNENSGIRKGKGYRQEIKEIFENFGKRCITSVPYFPEISENAVPLATRNFRKFNHNLPLVGSYIPQS